MMIVIAKQKNGSSPATTTVSAQIQMQAENTQL